VPIVFYVQAAVFFEKALARDPNYAAAYAGLADSNVMLGHLPAASAARTSRDGFVVLPARRWVSHEEAEQLLCTAILRSGMLPDPSGFRHSASAELSFDSLYFYILIVMIKVAMGVDVKFLRDIRSWIGAN
jgi:hypothetical protein